MIPQVPRFAAPRSYALIDTAEGLERWIEAACQAGTIAIWPVTSAVAGARPALAGIALALAPGLAAYVPLAHRPAAELDLAASHSRRRLSRPACRSRSAWEVLAQRVKLGWLRVDARRC